MQTVCLFCLILYRSCNLLSLCINCLKLWWPPKVFSPWGWANSFYLITQGHLNPFKKDLNFPKCQTSLMFSFKLLIKPYSFRLYKEDFLCMPYNLHYTHTLRNPYLFISDKLILLLTCIRLSPCSSVSPPPAVSLFLNCYCIWLLMKTSLSVWSILPAEPPECLTKCAAL